MGIIKMVDKLVAALNPFFRHYTKHRVIAFLVALVMIAGTIGIYLQNSACTFTTTTESGVETVIGDWADQKSFVDQKMALANPDRFPEGTERFVDMCTWDIQRNGAELVAEDRKCNQPPNEYWEHPVMASFPHAFHWCTMEEAERTPEAKSARIQAIRDGNTGIKLYKNIPGLTEMYIIYNDLIDQIQKDPEATMWTLRQSDKKARYTFFVNLFKSGKCQDKDDYTLSEENPDNCVWNPSKFEGNGNEDGIIPGMVSDGIEPEDLLWVHTRCILATAPFNVAKYKDWCEYMDSYPRLWKCNGGESQCFRPEWCGLYKTRHILSCLEDELMVDHLDLDLIVEKGYAQEQGTVASRRALFCNMFYSVA